MFLNLGQACYIELLFNQDAPHSYCTCRFSQSINPISHLRRHPFKLDHLRLTLPSQSSNDKRNLYYTLSQLQCPSLHLAARDLIPIKKLKIRAKLLQLDFCGLIPLNYLRAIARSFPCLEELTLCFQDQDSVQLQGAKFPKLISLRLVTPRPFGILLDFIPRCPRIQTISSSLNSGLLSTMKANFPRINFTKNQ
ncbi:hypothetical protein DSO57_1026999 [Entomophthora muscae]|uniref:Uncharacterized protein n=1 Tax=Entomophthora muscae TaxID=34485 RepID=A0ACC2TP65_9FUNG|nr:hypothetical protein DSO57_1026999 [Entomophthora muscae]